MRDDRCGYYVDHYESVIFVIAAIVFLSCADAL
jgi:hypothetical protein